VSSEDRSKAINAFNQDAMNYAKQADFIAQAKLNMEKKLGEILRSHGKTLEVRYENTIEFERD
jgi:hypothetical protein